MNDIQGAIDALPDSDNWGVEAARALIEAAAAQKCSDLHLACLRDGLLAQGRRDGALFTLARIPVARRDLLIARFKVLSELPAFVRLEPQDGRIEWRPAPDKPPVLLRVAFLPTIHGESVVVRYPQAPGSILTLNSLGMPQAVAAAVEGLLASQEGTLLLTGPSSSGKTTTIYAMLQRIHDTRGERANIVTIEDPVERDLGFAAQVQVNDPQGLTWDRALRAALRQDPNVLLIGEIRDEATARIAVQAGMTGHLVISTLHAGRAAKVFTRLLSIGVEPYLVASALTGVIAQRLVRLLCPDCRREDPAGGFRSEGCEACRGAGFRGRTGIFEVIPMTEPLRERVLERAAFPQIALEAAKSQTGDLAAEARRLAGKGTISRTEAEFVVAGFDEKADQQRVLNSEF
jgi:type II secretory ATPase GspE/PulE/Tfp pilus assembly ATPase PilB-like protein